MKKDYEKELWDSAIYPIEAEELETLFKTREDILAEYGLKEVVKTNKQIHIDHCGVKYILTPTENSVFMVCNQARPYPNLNGRLANIKHATLDTKCYIYPCMCINKKYYSFKPIVNE